MSQLWFIFMSEGCQSKKEVIGFIFFLNEKKTHTSYVNFDKDNY